jgi:hypothetical protein
MSSWADDPKLIEKIAGKLLVHMQKLGFRDSDTNRAQIKKFLGQNPQDYADAEAVEGAVEELARRAQRRLARRNVQPREVLPLPEEISSQTGLAWLTVDPKENVELAHAVEAVRLRFWQSIEPPFPFRKLGDKEALLGAFKWLKNRLKEDTERSVEPQVATITVSFDLKIPNPEDYFRVLESLETAFSVSENQQSDAESRLELAKIMGLGQVRLSSRSGPKIREELVFPHPNGARRTFLTKGGVLSSLWADVGAVVELSSWWSQERALVYVMTGLPPAPKHTYSFDPNPSQRVTTLKLQFQGPVQESEVINLYRKATRGWHEKLRVKASRLSLTQAALLQLRSETPRMTWTQRRSIWQEWRAIQPDLRDFGTRTPEQKMRKEWARGREKAGWQRGQKASKRNADTFNLPALLPPPITNSDSDFI